MVAIDALKLSFGGARGWSTLLRCALLVSALVGCATDTMSPPEAGALYRKRLAQMQAGNVASNYDPLEPVPGAARPVPLPLAASGERTIAASALADARDYAKRSNASAFPVWRNGALEEASYFGTTTRETELAALSLAKPLATIAIGRAMALGKIRSLDQPVADFIKEWRGTPKDKITLRQVLTMTSGLLPQDFTPDPASPLNRAYLDPYHDRVLIHDYPPDRFRGTRYAYSNANGELVALIIERATGKRYARFLSDDVLAPIGAVGGRVWIDRPNGLAHSGCCILLPAETWLRLGLLVLQDGQWEGKPLIGSDFVTAMTTPTPTNPHAGTMGLYLARRLHSAARLFPDRASPAARCSIPNPISRPISSCSTAMPIRSSISFPRPISSFFGREPRRPNRRNGTIA